MKFIIVLLLCFFTSCANEPYFKFRNIKTSQVTIGTLINGNFYQVGDTVELENELYVIDSVVYTRKVLYSE